MDGNGSLIPAALLAHVQRLTVAKQLWVAFSGGADSHVLLDLLIESDPARHGFSVGALHVHHGISSAADAWVLHCEQICREFRIPLAVRWVDGRVTDGQSPEAALREARFSAFQDFIKSGQCLLLAHHEADQAETILFRLLRGTGPLGLGGIREKAKIGEGELIRPLLSTPKEKILAYAKERKLRWVEDESNADSRFDRNFLRQTIMPVLYDRWPHVFRSINRAGSLSRQAALIIESLAKTDLEICQVAKDALSVKNLCALTLPRRQSVIRYWLQTLGYALPSLDHMQRIDREILMAKPGSRPRLKIGLYELYRREGELRVKLYHSVMA